MKRIRSSVRAILLFNISENGQGWLKLNGPCCGGGEHACLNLNHDCGPSYAKIEQGGTGTLSIKPCRLRSLVGNISKQQL